MAKYDWKWCGANVRNGILDSDFTYIPPRPLPRGIVVQCLCLHASVMEVS